MTTVTLSDERGEPGEISIEVREDGERVVQAAVPERHFPTDPATLAGAARRYFGALEAWAEADL